MLGSLPPSTRSLTGRLALFFTLMSCVIGLAVFLIFYFAIQWAEDRVGERRILIDRDNAVHRFIAGEQGKIALDELTMAYNDMSLIPSDYRAFLSQHSEYLGEIDDLSHMVYKGHYTDQGEHKPIVLLSLIDEVEFDDDEILYSGLLVIGLVAVLMFTFGTVLFRLSKRLIEPINHITDQLNELSGDGNREFTINPDAANEFQLLTARLNHYRHELNQTLKREQAFARYSSHELRTPLTVVKGANTLLQRSEHNAFQARQIERIDDATRQMMTMVDALLALVRYERNIDDAPLRFLEEAEVAAIIERHQPMAKQKQLPLHLEVTGQPQLRATPAVIDMVLGNLLRNAIAATEHGSIDVHLSTHSLCVIDDGEGLLDKPNQEGHGLGLMIVDDLCRRYGWQCSLTHHEARGCQALIEFGLS